MRHSKGTPLKRQAALIVLGAVIVACLALPTVASALTPSTISTTYMYFPVAKTFTISGHLSRSTVGKTMTIEVRKPGRSFWTVVGTPKINTYGHWSMKYFPKLGGKFYIRARYRTTTVLSRTATIYVKKGPGVKYQILLASTTSTRDSGLFEALAPMFQKSCPEYTLKATFVGSGAAMALGGLGDADVLLTHSPAAEVDFMHGIVAGAPVAHKGTTRFKVMYNDFVLVGPKTNPAGVTMSQTPAQAFQAIADAGSTFISRNDNSGTNAKELEIWKSIGSPEGTGTASYKPWYKASKMGMAAAISAANQQNGYTLADRSTWMTACSLQTTGTLVILNAGDPTLYNQYAVITVSGARNAEGAQDFSLWMRSKAAHEGQTTIASYGVNTFGTALFHPNAGAYPW